MGWPGPMTHRQFLVWLEWEQESKHVPSLNEWYIAQACCEVRRVMSSDPSSVKIEDFILEFRTRGEYTEEEKKTFSDVAKINWSRKMTMPITVISREQAVYIYPPGHPDDPANKGP